MRIVLGVKRQILLGVAASISKVCIIPLKFTDQLARIGIKQQFVMIESMPRLGVIRPVDPISIDRAGFNSRQIAVPDIMGLIRQHIAARFDLTFGIEQAQFHRFSMGGKQSEINTLAVPVSPQIVMTAC